MRHSRRLLTIGIATTAAVALTATFAFGANRPHGAPGISKTKVTLGAIVTQSGGLAADFAPYLEGVHAYLDYVNASGGIHGRSLDLAYALDDGSSGSTDVSDAQTLVNDDHVFAVVGVSVPFFDAHTFLAKSGTPTFGYSTANVWAGPKNLFADYGSVLDYNSSIPFFAYTAKMTKATKIAVIALGYASSADECQGAVKGLRHYKYDVVYSNLNESIIQNWSVEAENIYKAKANMIVSCMDDNSDVGLAKYVDALYGSKKPVQLWLDGYDRTFLVQNETYMQGVYILLQHVPFESATLYPKVFTGLDLYFAQMVKYGYSSDEYSEVALAGWESASLFAQGLEAAGANPTQAAVTADINKLKEDVGGPDGGVTAPTNWTIAHTKSGSPACETYVQAKGTNFNVAFGKGSDPWICFPLINANLDKPAKAPKGTPGA